MTKQSEIQYYFDGIVIQIGPQISHRIDPIAIGRIRCNATLEKIMLNIIEHVIWLVLIGINPFATNEPSYAYQKAFQLEPIFPDFNV